MDNSKLRGVIPALLTPLNQDQTIDLKGLDRLIEYQLAAGVSALFILGTNGEFPLITNSQRSVLIRATVKKVRGRVPVLVGTADTGTKRVIENTLEAKKLGADMAVVLPPYYYFVGEEELVNFFADIAQATRFPIIVYQNPYFTKIKMDFKTIARLKKTKNIVALKESSGDLPLVKRVIRELKSRDFMVFQGDKVVAAESVRYGADGLVSGIASMAPGLFVRLYRAAIKNDLKGADLAQAEIKKIITYCDSSWVRSFKYGLKLMHICQEHVATPFDKMKPEYHAQVRATLRKLGLL